MTDESDEAEVELGTGTGEERLRRSVLRDEPEAEAEHGGRASACSTNAVTSVETLPIVARLVIEVRSDGRRTLARGAITHDATGERAAVEAEAESPWALMKLLAKELAAMSVGAWSSTRAPMPMNRPRRMFERLRALRAPRDR